MHKIFPDTAWSILNSDNKTSPYSSDFSFLTILNSTFFPFFFFNLLSFQYFIRCFELLIKFNEYQSIFSGPIIPKVDSSFYMIRNLLKKKCQIPLWYVVSQFKTKITATVAYSRVHCKSKIIWGWEEE